MDVTSPFVIAISTNLLSDGPMYYTRPLDSLSLILTIALISILTVDMNPDRQSSQETSNMLSRSSLSSRLSGQRTGPKRQSLSGARLEKKRTADRESQRAGRERAKNYIRHLEMLVESLQQAQGDDRLKILTEQCQEQREQNERLISIISSIGRLSRSMELPATTPWIEPNPSTTSSPPVSTAGAAIESTVDQHPPTVRASGVDLGRPIPAYNNQSLWPQPSMSVMGEQPLTSNPLPICTGSSSPNVYSRTRMNINPVSNIQTQANIMQNPHISAAFTTTETMVETIPEAINNILTEAELFTVISTGPREDADIAIRAVVSGWNTVKRAYTLDQGWEALRRIDQEVFSSCGLIERLAILRVMRLKLRVRKPSINYCRALANTIRQSMLLTRSTRISNNFPNLCV